MTSWRGDVVELEAETVRAYLVERGLIDVDERARVELLGGGVSNLVVRFRGNGSCGVLKQPRRRLRVPFEWIAPYERARKERRCLDLLERILAPGSVPRVTSFDDERFVLVMTCAPHDARVWKDDLMQGVIDQCVAERAGRLLRLVHDRSIDHPEALAALDDEAMMEPLRIEPYYRATARNNPVVAGRVMDAADRLLHTKRTLVLGDYVPKNILIRGDGELFTLDYEVAHLGEPGYDLASLLNHLLLKAARFAPRGDGYVALARAFWAAYRTPPPVDEDRLARETVRHLGCLQLARVDGLSPVEYLDDERTRERVRQAARGLLCEPPASVGEAIERVAAGGLA